MPVHVCTVSKRGIHAVILAGDEPERMLSPVPRFRTRFGGGLQPSVFAPNSNLPMASETHRRQMQEWLSGGAMFKRMERSRSRRSRVMSSLSSKQALRSPRRLASIRNLYIAFDFARRRQRGAAVTANDNVRRPKRYRYVPGRAPGWGCKPRAEETACNRRRFIGAQLDRGLRC
jgi:hypothetical protein